MSFASDVKEEEARLDVNDDWKKGRLSAILQLNASLGMSSKGFTLNIKSTNNVIFRMTAQDLNALYHIRCGLNVIQDGRFNRKNSYEVLVEQKAREILEDLDLWTERGLQEHPRMSFLKNEDFIRSYLAGCFLAGGSINAPTSSNYHLELKANSEKHGDFIVKLMNKFNLQPKVTTRRDVPIVYLKAAQQIADFLAIIGVTDTLFEFEDERINRDFYNNAQRVMNVDIANDMKALSAANKQLAAIQFLKDNNAYRYLDVKDREVAELRIEFPDASLNELCQEYENIKHETLSKSGIRHRFEKIMAAAEKRGFRE